MALWRRKAIKVGYTWRRIDGSLMSGHIFI